MRKEKEQEKSGNKIILAVFLLIIIVIVVIVFFVHGRRKEQSSGISAEVTTESNAESAVEKWQEGTIEYNGKKYVYNTSLDTYLYIGVDQEGPVEGSYDGISGGQSDALFLLVMDKTNEKMSIFAINRNTMTNIDIYSESGEFLTTDKAQICLQHGYGDGMKQSCQRTEDAVSKLFYNIPIKGYFSLNMGAIPTINDAVGGVPVEVMDDLSSIGEHQASLKKGQNVTLNGDEAYVYLRSRDCNEFDSASERLARQMQYMTSFFKQAKGNIKDINKIMSVYNSIEDYTVSNVDFEDLAGKLLKYSFDEADMYTIPGEERNGTDYEEYDVDDEAFYDLVIKVFYQPVEN